MHFTLEREREREREKGVKETTADEMDGESDSFRRCDSIN
jgi:hypothetical protein